MAEKHLPTFTQWLARMQHNATSIGDLARFAATDPTWPGRAVARGELLTYLIEHGANDKTIKTFSHAWASYQQAIARALGDPGQAGYTNGSEK